VVAVALSAAGACSPAEPDAVRAPAVQQASPDPAATDPSPVRPTPDGPTARTSPAATPSPEPTPTPSPSPSARLRTSDGRPRAARLSIPALGIEDLRVQPHRGSPDDARGTRIQDGGIAASPHGPDGGVGPGGVGNHIITAHRLSSTQAFLDLPRLRVGARVHVEAGGRRYTYRITGTRITSFRSPRSLAAQSAAVPGRPGERATRAMITLSTCRTPEDRREGNYWSDEFGNPENRVDKIGVLVAVEAL
jgi:sortase A